MLIKVLLRNLHMKEFDVLLCDLDAALALGEPRSKKHKIGSSAYFSPEVMRWVVAEDNSESQPFETTAGMDVWAFGAVLFELCTGRHLFGQDISDDVLLRSQEKTKLCAWNDISDIELEEVFSTEWVEVGTKVIPCPWPLVHGLRLCL